MSEPAGERAREFGLSGIVLVTGTGTDVGKTVVTAALAAAAMRAGQRVVVVKPVQTGAGPGEAADLAEVLRLVAPLVPATYEFVRLPEPLAPQAAARRAGVRLPPLAEAARPIAALAAGADLVLVEGAGGVLVRLDGEGAEGSTLIDLAVDLQNRRHEGEPARPVTAVVVTGAGLGTLNVAELTVKALQDRGVPVRGLVVGSWPAEPGPAERENLTDLPELTGVPLLGVVAEGPARPPLIEAAQLIEAPQLSEAPQLIDVPVPAEEPAGRGVSLTTTGMD